MNTTLRVDVTKQTSQWNRIQIASAFALFFSLETAVSTLFEVIKGGYSTGRTDHTGLFVQIPLFLFSLFMIWQTWKYGSIFNRQSLIKIKYAFMIAATLMLLFSTYLILSFLDDDAERSISQLK